MQIPSAVRAATIGWVSQEIVLFSGTVRENLTLFDNTISFEAMIEAARDAEIHDVITRRPGGYDSFLLEGGTDLSGGEAQRLEIARTLAGEPSFLILDEATSALDPLVEEQIEQNLRERKCGALVVAHRLSTVRDADEIVVLEGGRIVERGTHDQLLALAGRYQALINT
jgi:ABC-type multidrug transport system fused ATPase/permease subunit